MKDFFGERVSIDGDVLDGAEDEKCDHEEDS